jgi:hypothetical protein
MTSTTPNPNPINNCPHEFFDAEVDTKRDTFKVFVIVQCRACKRRLHFQPSPGQITDRAELQGFFL